MKRPYVPSSIENTCLKHLDEVENWRILREERPTETTRLPWWPFRRIFAINWFLFSGILLVIFIGISSTAGTGADFRSDLPVVVLAALITATGLAIYVMLLYRWSWNRRAAWLGRDDPA